MPRGLHIIIIIIIRFLINVQLQGHQCIRATMGPLPGNWLAARIADLTPDLQLFLSWGSTVVSFHSQQSFSVSFFQVSLGLPAPRLQSICISHAVLTAPLECSTCPNQRSLLSLKMKLKPSISSFASTCNSLDHTVTTSSGLILQICLIIALQALPVCLGQWQSSTGIEHGAPRARAVYMAMGLVTDWLVGWFCCFTSQVNSYGHCGTVSPPNHTFSWAGLNKRLTSNLCTYFRL